ncbi:winged helix-turn-helix domain-containing protein [Cupriavidus sp. RAF12]|uniref:winged helix-turn-helix domain-containing protein n=1 Tax=Cupriavidus sp. RAF12 TaxID=3233050 RepID=UPI003F8E53CD
MRTRYKLALAKRTVTTPNEIVRLSPIESRLIELLFKNVDCTVTRGELETHTWDRYLDATSRTLDAHISRLRKKLALDGTHGLSLRAQYYEGYRLERV